MNPIDTPSLQPKENSILSGLKGFISSIEKLVPKSNLFYEIGEMATKFCEEVDKNKTGAETALSLGAFKDNTKLGMQLQLDAVKRLEVWKQQSTNDQHYA